ncbi:MAG: TlpA disulfide reductase family protein, partial [Bacteroidales bacterium]
VLMDEVTAKKLESLEKHPRAEELSEAFKHHFVTEVHYDKYNRLLGYAASHQRFNQLEEPPVLPEGYYDFLDQAIHADVKCLNSETCAAFLMAYLNHQAALQPDRFDEQASPNETGYLLAKENLTGPASEYVQLINISREFNYGDLDKATAMYQEFMANSQVQDYRDRMTNTWNSIQSMMPGNPAPEFTMTDMDGNTVSLSDYRGKVVFLKFWASWCGPCMRQVPPAAELKERMAGQEDLVFLYVSIDTDTDAWRSTIERHNIKGVHMNTPGRERGVPALYQVKWIPTFYIIGRDGNIFHNRPPQPSEEDVDRVLMEALAQEV